MKKGGRRVLVIPAALGYGDRGAPPRIPGGATLRFDVELIDFKTPPPAPTPLSMEGKQRQRTASGLQYIVYEEGSGESPQPGTRVSVHYAGFLEDGTLFDTSITRGQPIQFVLGAGQVIRGWDEGIALMKPGAKYKLIIPSSLGYGDRGAGPIPPGATLHFDVERVAD